MEQENSYQFKQKPSIKGKITQEEKQYKIAVCQVRKNIVPFTIRTIIKLQQNSISFKQLPNQNQQKIIHYSKQAKKRKGNQVLNIKHLQEILKIIIDNGQYLTQILDKEKLHRNIKLSKVSIPLKKAYKKLIPNIIGIYKTKGEIKQCLPRTELTRKVISKYIQDKIKNPNKKSNQQKKDCHENSHSMDQNQQQSDKLYSDSQIQRRLCELEQKNISLFDQQFNKHNDNNLFKFM